MLKIYKHLKAQAQIKVQVGSDKDGKPIFQNVKFTGGRVMGNEHGTLGGAFHTHNEVLQKALESRGDFGKNFFIDHKIDKKEEVLPEETDFKIYPGIDIFNRVKNILKKDYADKIKGEDQRNPESVLKFCTRNGIAFPDFFTVDQGHFSKYLEEKPEAPMVEPVEETEEVEVPVQETPETPEEEDNEEEAPEQEFDEVEVDLDELREMLRKDLNKKAEEFGVKNPESLPNKESVVQAILNI